MNTRCKWCAAGRADVMRRCFGAKYMRPSHTFREKDHLNLEMLLHLVSHYARPSCAGITLCRVEYMAALLALTVVALTMTANEAYQAEPAHRRRLPHWARSDLFGGLTRLQCAPEPQRLSEEQEEAEPGMSVDKKEESPDSSPESVYGWTRPTSRTKVV